MASKQTYDLIVIGGGAAGFFAALSAKETSPHAAVLILERSSHLLSKVRISGGGRCNVTHACFDPIRLASHYPRGGKALIGPFTRFHPRNTVDWFAGQGVSLKTEPDGRMFPVTDSSQTIIDCLLKAAQKLHVEIRLKQQIIAIEPTQHGFNVGLEPTETLACRSLILATGSHPHGHAFAKNAGHTIQDPVPSLFTFNVPGFPLADLAGISVDPVSIRIADSAFEQKGALLLTHWGFSGPAALKLSAWGARHLHQHRYKIPLTIDWLPHLSKQQIFESLRQMRCDFPNRSMTSHNPFNLPKKLWNRFLVLTQLDGEKRVAETSNEEFHHLSNYLKSALFQVDGKTTHKEEFVTCGGVSLDEVNFKTMESRLCRHLHFAGEILDIDAVTGGFNFQNAWTTGWIAGQEALLKYTEGVYHV